MYPLYVAVTDKQHFFRSDIHAFRIDDANRTADRPASTFSRPRLLQIQGRITGGGIEGSCSNMGYL